MESRGVGITCGARREAVHGSNLTAAGMCELDLRTWTAEEAP